MAAQIVGRDSIQIVDVDTHGSAHVLLHDASGAPLGTAAAPLNVAEVSSPHPAAGGFYSVAGGLTAVVAVSLAANTSLMAMRLSPVSTRKAKVSRFRVNISIATVGATALVPGILGLQRFTTATPTGGSARTVNKMAESLSRTSDMTDVRDLNSALTVTSVVFGNVVAQSRVPIVISGATSYYEWIIEPPYPIVLNPGDGLCLRTQSIMPATQTWLFDYTAYWTEE